MYFEHGVRSSKTSAQFEQTSAQLCTVANLEIWLVAQFIARTAIERHFGITQGSMYFEHGERGSKTSAMFEQTSAQLCTVANLEIWLDL